MRTFCTIFLLLLCGGAFGHESRPASRPAPRSLPRVRYDELRATWSGDSLYLSLRLRFEGPLPCGGCFMGVFPRFGRAGYPGIGYFRPSELRYYRRRQLLDPTSSPHFSHVATTTRHGTATVDYRGVLLLPFTESDSLLHLETRFYGCRHEVLTGVSLLRVPPRPERRIGGEDRSVSVRRDLPRPVAVVSWPLYEANVTLLRPAPEPQKERVATATLRITYPVNSSHVLPSFGQNAAELSRLDSLLGPMASDTATYRIGHTHIAGYASPEDTYDYNLRLSHRRATQMRRWLVDRYGLRGDSVTVSGEGEDWASLRRAVATGSMAHRDEVLRIIDGYGIMEGREKRLMDLHCGRPYTYMLEHYFPALRRMELEMNYTVRAFTPREAGSILERRPQDLSLREIYDVARTRNTDLTIRRHRTSYGREYDIAVRYFPDDVVAKVNASSAALVRGDLEAAYAYLQSVAGEPLAANNLGVYYWLCGDADTAASCFRRAMQSDPERARHNLEELARWRQGHDR